MTTSSYMTIPTFTVDGASLPEYAHEHDAGADLRAANKAPIVIYPGQTKLVQTGLMCAVPEGFELQVRSKSGLALKHSVFVLNSPGCVDASFRGEIGVILHNAHEHNAFTVEPGMKVAQAVISPVVRARFEKVEALTETSRGSGAYGSTGL